MSLERIHVHIGAPKTGSTAVQAFLAGHRSALATRGVRYPDVSLRGWGHHDVAFLLGGGYPEWARPQPLGLRALSAKLATAVQPGDRILVLSSEDFFLFPAPARLRQWLGDALGALPPITIDAYLRPQHEVLPSWYNQLVKAQGFAGSFEDSVTRDGHLWDYDRALAPWAEEFGDEALRVWAYPSGDVRTHYLQQIDAGEHIAPPPPGHKNQRIIRDVLEYQRLVNQLPLPTADKRAFHKRLIALSHAEPRPPALVDAPVVSRRRLAALAARYDDSNTAVERRFGLRGRLFAPPDPMGDVDAAPPEPQIDYAGPSPEALALITAWLQHHAT